MLIHSKNKWGPVAEQSNRQSVFDFILHSFVFLSHRSLGVIPGPATYSYDKDLI